MTDVSLWTFTRARSAPFGTEQMILTDDIVQAGRPQPAGQGAACSESLLERRPRTGSPGQATFRPARSRQFDRSGAVREQLSDACSSGAKRSLVRHRVAWSSLRARTGWLRSSAASGCRGAAGPGRLRSRFRRALVASGQVAHEPALGSDLAGEGADWSSALSARSRHDDSCWAVMSRCRRRGAGSGFVRPRYRRASSFS